MSHSADATCPICIEAIEDLSALICGHVFCGECIRHWHRVEQRGGRLADSCPVCRTPQVATQLAPLAVASIEALDDRASAAQASAHSRVAQVPTVYPVRQSIRSQLERAHADRASAYERRLGFESRLARYQSELVSPISGRPLHEIERIRVEDFDKVFGRGSTARNAALSSIMASSSSLGFVRRGE
jgi:hypothetical protein